MKKWKSFSDWRLRTKLFFILALCLVVSMLLSVYNMFHISRAYDRELYGALSNFLSLSVTEIGYKLDNVQQMTTDLGQDSQIQTYLSHNKDASRAFSSEYNALYYLVQDYYKKNRVNCVSNITLYTGNFTLRSNTSANVYVPDEVYKDLYEAALGANGATVCVTDYSRDYGLFFVKAIRRIANLRLDTLGIEVVQMDLEKLVKSSVSLNQYDNVIFVLTRPQDGAVMYSSAGEAGPQTLPTLDTESRWDICKLDSVKYFVTADGSADYPWDYLCLVPYNEIYASIRDALLFCILFFLAGIALTFLVCHFLVDRITRRFAKLISQMDQFAKYTPDMVLPVDEFSGEEREAGDEVGMLSRHFSHMAREIDGLIQTDYTNRILLREAQLKALEAQINPHFLYNTLSAINWRAKMRGAQEISDMVEALSNLLRVTLNDDSGLIPLEKELSLVQSYIVIQRIRFDETLDYRLAVEADELKDVLIPKLTLQPLIENAIRYGLEQSTQICRVQLSVRRQGAQLVLLVQNDGSLYEDNLLEKLRQKTVTPHGYGIGLLNIEKRLEFAFGKEAGLELYNEDGMATARITIPCRVS
ncbi:sensor histidine kinase [Ruthenibacterium lactatiformans]|uniref:HAMP domain-containing protein n=1 Tax=Ruthenibacterium lactatiformans TaxID=1550024 RepID=A0A6I3QTD7_9FIRM|nr:sensor histidine kinase [Ruthenibacterium lactatiformans]MTS16953.1 HAMP domain-containing protein [Ruthenibacterium lactatiformans]MTS20363.1 HAMP domain-containing protein [Ruthenibacterium lactatiformans]MTS36317.1 HAMP domain-containing protein [Ruthenibacterium lactatiformans]MTS49737.1 HAMP domain-containing protein [Ruthenibacterium lactatiformans]MTS53112.1 HAMP domain-containing protein [Ruthenibacterium lactatiformans]